MKRRCALALALVLALLLAVRLFYAFWPSPMPQVQPSPSSSAAPAPTPERTLALLGSSTDPKCEPLYDALGGWCRSNGWSFISYDCYGWSVSQGGQVDDLVGHESADVALLWPTGSQEELDGWAKALHHGGCRVITLNQSVSAEGEAYVDCHLATDPDALATASAAFLATVPNAGREVLVLVDLPDAPLVEPTLNALERAGLNVAEYGACWGQSQYAQEYLTWALEHYPHAGAVLSLSREGISGAREALAGRNIPILYLNCDPDALGDPTLDGPDAALGVSPQETLDKLTQAITKVARGEDPGRLTLQVTTVTAPTAGPDGEGED